MSVLKEGNWNQVQKNLIFVQKSNGTIRDGIPLKINVRYTWKYNLQIAEKN